MVVSYHVFTVNNRRESGPDVMDAAGGKRKVMRKLIGGMESQELQFK
jgi:hypothetical protein